ncbi:fibronectin type III domain-containing protein [Alsobacter sp. R-9]
MIPGITANVTRDTASGGTGPSYGQDPGTAWLDFVNGEYWVEGVQYEIGDLLQDYPGVTGSFNAADVVPGRGLRAIYRDPQYGPMAKGPLLALMQAAFTYVGETEDIYDGTVTFLQIGSSTGSGTAISLYCGAYLNFLYSGVSSDSTYSGITTGRRVQWLGTNRAAATVGTSTSGCSLNGSLGTEAATIDTSDIFLAPTVAAADRPSPAGSDILDAAPGYFRSIRIEPPVAASGLAALTTLATPGYIEDLATGAITGTTVELTFSAVSGATSYEYWIGEGNSWPDDTNDTWTTLPNDKVIAGLTPVTLYTILVRARNSYGPGGCYTPDSTNTYFVEVTTTT